MFIEYIKECLFPGKVDTVAKFSVNLKVFKESKLLVDFVKLSLIDFKEGLILSYNCRSLIIFHWTLKLLVRSTSEYATMIVLVFFNTARCLKWNPVKGKK